jgi:two-component system, cell cycle sensor histidine kinase and response regulator CckA
MNQDAKPSYRELQCRLEAAESELAALRNGQIDVIMGNGPPLMVRLAETEAREAHLKNVLRAIRNVDQLIVKETDPERLIAGACENLTQTMGYHSAWVALLDPASRRVTQTASSGFNGGFAVLEEKLLHGDWPAVMCRGLETGGIVVVREPVSECTDCPLSIMYQNRAGLCAPLVVDNRQYGILSASVPAALADDAEEQALFTELADDLAFGIHKIEGARDLEKALEKIRLSEEKFSRVFAAIPDAVSLSTVSDGKIVEVNDAFVRLSGYPKEQLMGGPSSDIKLWVKPEARKKYIAQLFQDGWVLNFEADYRNRSGTVLHMLISGTIVDSGKDRLILSILRDVTAYRRQSQQISLLGRMLDDAPASITVHDTAGRFLFATRRTFAMHGYEKDEFMAVNLQDLDVPETAALLAERFEKIKRDGEASFEEEHFRKDGTRFPLHVVARAIQWEGRPAVLSIAADITDQKQAELERERLQNQLVQAQKMESVGRLAGGVAHDFNNMLCVILGHAELALEGLDQVHPIYADLTAIDHVARRSADLVRQLLAFARKQTIAPKVLDLNETVEGILKILRRLLGEDINLNWQPCAGVWPVKMDPSQIDQVLANLCINARDAIAGGGNIVIQTDNVTIDQKHRERYSFFVPGDYVLLAVSDTGCGMDRETQQHLFEPFFTTKEVGKGTGLGLATIYGIIKQNNGFITVDSEPDRGATFNIYLPRCTATIDKGQERKSTTSLARGNETVLLVEDEPSVLKMGKIFLERLGYRVLNAATPEEAIRLASENADEIQLLITDVVMPEMNGKELAENLMSVYPGMKRLFMSGYTADVIADHGLLDDGVHFIQKPFSLADLAGKVRGTLDEYLIA